MKMQIANVIFQRLNNNYLYEWIRNIKWQYSSKWRYSHLASCLGDVSTNLLGLVLALLHEHGVALLGVHLFPDDGLVGGHVHAELLVVQVHGVLLRPGVRVAVVHVPSVYQVLTATALVQFPAGPEDKTNVKIFYSNSHVKKQF